MTYFPAYTCRGHQRGIALLGILLMLTLLIALAHEITLSFRSQLVRTQSLQQKDQARWYALAGESLAIKTLVQSFEDEPDVSHLGQYWATDNASFPLEGGQVSGSIKDAQSCFNINALAKAVESDDKQQEQMEQQKHSEGVVFTALLENLDIPEWESEQITMSTSNWVSTKDVNEGENDDYYLALPLPYLTGKTLMRDISEWRAVAGVSKAVANKVMPYLCALPVTKLSVNVNTIPDDQPELLAALFTNSLSVDEALSILEERPDNGWESMAEFYSQSLLSGLSSTAIDKHLTIVSNYFEMSATASFGTSEAGLKSLLARAKAKSSKKNQLTVIRRKFGGV